MQPATSPDKSRDPHLPKETVPELQSSRTAGDPELGILHYLRQVHSIYNEPPEELVRIGRYQHRILSYLEHHEIEHVFVEGLYSSFDRASPDFEKSCGEYHYWLLQPEMRAKTSPVDLCRHVASAFGAPDYRANPSDEQLLYLGALGAYFVHACLSPAVSLHRTVSANADARIGKRLSEIGDPEDPISRKIRFDLRERMAVNEVAAFLRKEPGTNVALIYGAMHEIADDVAWRWKDKPPVLIDVSFPAALEEWRSVRCPQAAEPEGSTPG